MAITDSISSIILLVGMAASLALAGYAFVRSRGLAQMTRKSIDLLSRRRESHSNISRVLRVAEEAAGFGVWQYSPGEDQQYWSRGLRQLFGLDPNEQMVKGDAETLLQANGIEFEVLTQDIALAEGMASTRVKVQGLDDRERFLDLRLCPARRLRSPSTKRYMAIFLDVTEQLEREEHLQLSTRQAIAEAKIAREEANRDPLTNLANRRYLMNELDRRLTRQQRQNDELSIILFDIDHFKAVNDQYGHLAGDTVLRRIARIAGEQAREGDLVGRIGGEEFVWIVNGADTAMTQVISERLRRAVALQSGVGKIPPVTISIGSVSAEVGDSSLALFARADEALYEAKSSGRNAVRMAA